MSALLAFTNQGQIAAVFAFIFVMAIFGAFGVWRGWGV